MKVSAMTGRQSFDSPLGRLTWHPAYVLSNSIELKDATGKLLAKGKKSCMASKGRRTLEILVPVDEYVSPLSEEDSNKAFLSNVCR
jgi:hypothetical protein